MGRRPLTVASLLALMCATGSMMVVPSHAEGAGFHDGWCQKDEGFAVVVYWPAKPADVEPEIPGNLDSKTLVRCIIGAHKTSGDGREDVLKLAGLGYATQGDIVTTINGIESDAFAEIPAYWWYHTGTREGDSGGRWDPKSSWTQSLNVNDFGLIVFSSDSEQLPPVTPNFAKGGDHGDEPGPGPGPGPGPAPGPGPGPSTGEPSHGPTGKPSHGPTGEPTHKPTSGHDKPTGKPTRTSGHGGDKPSHEPGRSHGGDHHDRPNPTAPNHADGPRPHKKRDRADSRPNTISTVTATPPTPSLPTVSSASPSRPRPSSPSATPSSPTPSPRASSPAASAGSSLAPQSSSPVWGREDHTRRSPDEGEHKGAPWWVPVGIGVVALAGLALAPVIHRRHRRGDQEDEE
ncbi:hypothetical protein O6R08_08310 [Cutibacterium equinum]|uniref:Uncharacterized protein n=1 Tax=Cutibacterium equinum TaxID=3016342 RepID=A0ABY7QWT6_9ACTN|nr:hypothetical protein [Cutibacterium equinum]WCC79510.1 hypothetical protein O6R08_08310 [Cutibacterium equinum]